VKKTRQKKKVFSFGSSGQQAAVPPQTKKGRREAGLR
jgi:hypothetical protein